MMRDAKFFEDPLEFRAFRFAKDSHDLTVHNRKTRAADPSERWLVWGFGRTLWYVLFTAYNFHGIIRQRR